MTMFEKYKNGLLPKTIYTRVRFAESPEEKLFCAGYFTANAINRGEIKTSLDDDLDDDFKGNSDDKKPR